MSSNQKAVWALLHIVAIASVLISLSSGLRIAILEYPFLLKLHYFLPQGQMQSLHLYSACALTLCVIIYSILLIRRFLPNMGQFNKQKFFGRYHWYLAWFIRFLLTFLLATGWLLYAEMRFIELTWIKLAHLIAAGLMALYLLLHGGGYFLQQGLSAIKRLVIPLQFLSKKICIVGIALSVIGGALAFMLFNNHQHRLIVTTINDDVYIHIDGLIDEAIWQQAKPLTIHTHGGANFNNGATAVTIRALRNSQDAFFHFSWQDDSQSLQHLPLVKTQSGWQVQQEGFKDFDERRYYEDKFAVILSDNCKLDAAGTAHLGPKPLADKPKHWTGKGYHYTQNSIVDLWQWKAVRSNPMRLMDDNYIGQPTAPRMGERRYTAGYQQDARESGAYKMNWQWFYSDGIVPKRLPIDKKRLLAYQTQKQTLEKEHNPDQIFAWGIPWFDSQPYLAAKDDYALGTVMPSILYSSNQFEGDRAHVRAFATWSKGYWSLEVFRRLDTKSVNDVAIKDKTCMWVAAFDQAQIAHTRHTRPIKLELK